MAVLPVIRTQALQAEGRAGPKGTVEVTALPGSSERTRKESCARTVRKSIWDAKFGSLCAHDPEFEPGNELLGLLGR